MERDLVALEVVVGLPTQTIIFIKNHNRVEAIITTGMALVRLENLVNLAISLQSTKVGSSHPKPGPPPHPPKPDQPKENPNSTMTVTTVCLIDLPMRRQTLVITLSINLNILKFRSISILLIKLC